MDEAEVGFGVLLKCLWDVDEDLVEREEVVRYQRPRTGWATHGLHGGAHDGDLIRGRVGQLGHSML